MDLHDSVELIAFLKEKDAHSIFKIEYKSFPQKNK